MDNYIAILYTTLIICAATTNCSGQNWSTENLENQFSSANETHSRHNYDSRTNRSRVSKQLKIVDSTSQANDAVDLVRLLDLWDPSLLIEVWKREPRNVRVSQKCDEDISRFLTGLESSSTWAFKNRWSACGRNFEEWFHPLTPFLCRYKKNMFNSLQCSTTYMSFNEIESGYFNDASRQRVWDASGRHTWGLFSGGEFWLGASDQCREMDDNIVELMNISNHSKSDENPEVPPYRVSVNSVKLHLEILPSRMNSSHDITIGLCLPSNCRPGDVAELIGYTSNKIFSDSSRRVMIRHVRNLSEGYNFSEDPIFYVMLISFGLASFLVVLGTLYDVALRYRVLNQEDTTRKKEIVDGEGAEEEEHDGATKVMGSKRDFDEQITISRLWSIKQHNGSLDVWNAKDVPRPLSEALLSFSMLLNISKMASLDVGDDTLAPIHGLRFISIFWIILVHTCLMTNEVSDNKMFRSKAEEDFLYQTISNGTYAVDTFFFISGCLVSFLYFRAMSKQRIKELKITQGFTGKIMQFLGMMSYRYFRLTPPYLLVIGLVQISTKWYHDHSVIELTTLDHQTCERFWWRNALYINTYFDMDDRCMVWSWYLANDTQFYTIGIIILIIAASVVSVGVLIGAVILIASWITTTAIALSNNHAATCFLVCPCGLSRSQLVKACKEPFAHYESLYDKPWTRIGPYLIGMAAGWYLCRIECKLKLSKTLTLLGWTLSIVTLLSIVYGLYGNHFHPISSALYTALSHSAWALSVGFVLIACVTGNGGGVEKILSWKYVYPLSRLTYCVYLIHPVLLRVIILHGESSIHLTRGFMSTNRICMTKLESADVIQLLYRQLRR